MGFQKGHKWSPGRPKGSINKKTEAFVAVLRKHNFDVAEALLEIYHLALDTFHNGHPDERMIGLKIAADAVKEIAAYSLPKLKSIEHTNENPLDHMTKEEKLEAMKSAVKMLESEIDKE